MQGEIDCAIAGGADSASDIPLSYSPRLQRTVLSVARNKSWSGKLASIGHLRPWDLAPAAPGIAEPRTGLSMGQHCEEMAKEWKISRREQDEVAREPQERRRSLALRLLPGPRRAVQRSATRQQRARRHLARETRLAQDRVRFERCGHADGRQQLAADRRCSLRLTFLKDWARSRGMEPQAFISHSETAAVDFVGMSGPKEGMLMAPAYAVPRMLERAGMKLQDFDIYEIHEAFAAQVLCTLKAWESDDFCRKKLGREPLGSIDRSKMNPKGSSVALGHPFAATGARIVATLAKELKNAAPAAASSRSAPQAEWA